jgi:hypothetical protein
LLFGAVIKKTALAISLGLTLLFSFFFYGALIQPVNSQSLDTIYIKSDGSVDGTDLIERNNSTYTFLNDISGSVVISKDFITLDGSGYALKGIDISSQKRN